MVDEAGLKQSQCQMSIYYKYAPYGYKLVVLSYVDYCLYWYKSEELVKYFLDTLVNRSFVNLLVYTPWFMSIRISQLNEYSISIDKGRYSTYIVAKYIYTDTMK